MMKKFSELQARLAETQQKLAETQVKASSGGGAVTVIMTAEPKLKSISIQQEAVDPDDIDMLQDLIEAATNEALQKAQEAQAQLMGSITGGLNIPGLPPM